MKKKNGILKKVLLVALSLCVLLVVGLLDPNIGSIGDAWSQLTPVWLLLALACEAIYWAADSTTHFFTTKLMRCHQSWPSSLMTSMIGVFYNAITPFSMGGQPMQVMQMRRKGISTGAASSVLLLKFLAWQIVMTVLGTVGLAVDKSIVTDNATMLVLFIIGYILNAGCLLVAILALISRDWLARCGKAVLRFLARIRILRKPETVERVNNNWEHFLNDYREATQLAIRNWRGMIPIVLSAAASAVAYLSVTYCVYRGLGLNAVGYGPILLMQALLTISVSYVPLPGASVASEGGFYLVFSRLFPEAYRFPGVLLWRVFTYYANIIFGLGATLIDGLLTAGQKKAPNA